MKQYDKHLMPAVGEMSNNECVINLPEKTSQISIKKGD